jgi:hypothetical protein
MLGVAYEAPSLATGYGAYLAQVSSGPSDGEKRNRNEKAMLISFPWNFDKRGWNPNVGQLVFFV